MSRMSVMPTDWQAKCAHTLELDGNFCIAVHGHVWYIYIYTQTNTVLFGQAQILYWIDVSNENKTKSMAIPTHIHL